MKRVFLVITMCLLSVSLFAQSSSKIRARRNARVKVAVKALEDSTAYLHVANAFTADYRLQGNTFVQVFNFLADTSSANDTYGGTITPAPDSLNTGMVLFMTVGVNNTGACTIAPNGLTAKSVKTASGADPANSDIVTTGVSILVYDGTNWVLINPATTCD